MKKQSLRVIVSAKCNYRCDYCCNHFMLKKFTRDKNPLALVKDYENIVITGGEPLMPDNLDRTITLLNEVVAQKKNAYIYSNLSCLPPHHIVPLVTGWSIGFHPTQVGHFYFAEMVNALLQMGARNVRIHVQDKELEKLKTVFAENKVVVPLMAWVMDDCDKSYKEDYVIWQ